MNRHAPALFIALCVVGTVVADDFETKRLENWHQWRGPNANGYAPKGDPPTRWDQSTNIRWKTAIEGVGSATPIVWDDRIYLLSAINTNQKVAGGAKAQNQAQAPSGANQSGRRRGGRFGRGGFSLSTPTPTTLYQFLVVCLDRNTGKMIWRKKVGQSKPHAGHHPTHGYASCSPVTDGKHLYASFGSSGLYCMDLNGQVKWKRDLGKMNTRMGFGEGTSPVLAGNALIVNWDHEGQSFIVCLDRATGKEKWKTLRDESTTWNTPLIVKHQGVTQVVVNGTNRTRSYDLATGKLLWQCGGQAKNPIPSPLALDGVVYCMSGFRGFAISAIRLDARGDVSNSKSVVWRRDDAAPYVASPLLYDDLLYITRERNGILSCINARTGKQLYGGQRLSEVSTLYASLVGASGKVYITGRNGTTYVVKHGPEFIVLATNKLGEGVDASPVIIGKKLYLRGQKNLYCISEH